MREDVAAILRAIFLTNGLLAAILAPLELQVAAASELGMRAIFQRRPL